MELNISFPGFKTKAVTLSYDDGSDSDCRMISILDKYGLKCTFNICSGWSCKGNAEDKAHVAELYKNHEIAVHTVDHRFLDRLSQAEVAQQIINDRIALESMTGKIVDGMAYPYGLSDTNNEPEIARICGINYARTVGATFNFQLPRDFLRWVPTCHHKAEKLFELTDAFLSAEGTGPHLLYVWGHSHEFANDNNWERLEEFCKKVSSRDDIWYATNGEIANYIKAFKQLKFSCDGNLVYNPTDKKLYLNSRGKEILIESGKTINLSEVVK